MKIKKKRVFDQMKNQRLLLKRRIDLYLETRKMRALNKEEKNKLYFLKLEENGLLTEQIKVMTAEESVPFVRMYEEGICQVTDTFFSKIVEFEDINYELLDTERRREVRNKYEDLLNHFGNEMKAEFFYFNRKIPEEVFKRRIEIKDKEDEFSMVRTEYAEMLKNQSAKGTNGIKKSKFLLFGGEFESYEEARGKLNDEEGEVCKLLTSMGAGPKGLNGEEWLTLLYEYFNQPVKKEYKFDFKEVANRGITEKDLIVPKAFDFSEKDEFRSGSNFGRSYVLNLIGPVINDERFSGILLQEGNFSVSTHFYQVSTKEAIKEAKEALTRVQSRKIDEQKKAFREGYDMDILPSDMKKSEADALKLVDNVSGSNQKLFHTNIIITVFGKNKKERDAIYKKISSRIATMNSELVLYDSLQEECFFSGSPILYNGFSEISERTLLSKDLSILIPFTTQELIMKGNAIYYGLNLLSNNLILADRKRLINPNGLIIGAPGYGKSFFAKREIIAAFLQSNDEIIICDPEGEYYPVIEALGGQVIRLAANSSEYLNPMDIQISHKDDTEALRLKSSFIITLLDLIAGEMGELGNDEKGIVDDCIRSIYDEYFENPAPENMPTLEDLYKRLLTYNPGENNPYMDIEMIAEIKAQAIRIANSMKLYVSGSQNYFNHQTNVDSKNRIICFDIKDLTSQLKKMGMLIVQDAVWNRVSKNRERGIATRYYCDEFHLLLKEKQTADYSIEMWKRFRKWGGIPTGLTQNIKDFMVGENVSSIVENTSTIIIFNCGPTDREILQAAYKLTDKQMDKISNAEKGSGLLIMDGYVIPFYDRYPKDTETYRIMNTKPKEETFDG